MLKVNNNRERQRATKWKDTQQMPKRTPASGGVSGGAPRDLGDIFAATRPYSQAGISIEHIPLEPLPYDLALGAGMGWAGPPRERLSTDNCVV